MHTPEGSNRLDGVRDLTDQDLTELFQALKAPGDAVPRAGFYARVMERVESQQKNSIWSVFLEPVFSRLAVASLAMMLLMGFVLFSDNSWEPDPGEVAFESANDNPPIVLMGEDEEAPVAGVHPAAMARHGVGAFYRTQPVGRMADDEGRDLVLADLVSYRH